MKALGILVVALCLTVGVASADYILTMETARPNNEASGSEVSKIYMTSDMMKIAQDDESTSMIFSAKDDKLYIVDDAKKSYMAMSKESLAEMGAQIGGAMSDMMKQAEEALAKLPPEQRAAAEKYMKEQMKSNPMMSAPGAAPEPKNLDVKKTGDKKSIGGKSCTKYDVSEDGAKTHEMWVAGWSETGMKKSDFGVFYAFGEFMAALAASMPMGNAQEMRMMEVFEKVDGVPMWVRNFEGSTVTTENTVTGIEKASLDASTFAIPDGYTLTDPMEGLKGN